MNNWSPSYPRRYNYSPTMFWVFTATIFLLGYIFISQSKQKPRPSGTGSASSSDCVTKTKTDKDNKSLGKGKDPGKKGKGKDLGKLPISRNYHDDHSNSSCCEQIDVTILSREQTEEWKGWMQILFIMYHYYRAYYMYNEIRVFVSAYVWMTGFGNFQFFEKKKDFSLARIVSMVTRINFFPVLLTLTVSGGLKDLFRLYYVVPLHTGTYISIFYVVPLQFILLCGSATVCGSYNFTMWFHSLLIFHIYYISIAGKIGIR